LTDWVLAGSVTVVCEFPPEVLANLAPDEVDARLTVMFAPDVVGFPLLSSRVMVN
jgi:hypothetical protein